jgi:multiple sugar transport system substrate-binding protein
MSEELKRKVAQLGAKEVSRRRVLMGAAGLGAAAASSVFAVPNVVSQEKTPVVFWTTFSADGLANVTAIVDAFNAQSADVAVEIVQLPPAEVSDSSRLLTAVRGGEGPDVYHLDRFIVAERAANGALQDLTPLCEANGVDPSLSDWVSFAAAEALYNGAPYALPFDTDLRGVYYNRTLAEAHGVDVSAMDPANGPITWDAFNELAAQFDVTDANGNFTQMGFVPQFAQSSPYTYGFSFGGTFMDWENCQVTPDNEGVIAGGQYVYDYNAAKGPDKVQAFIQAATVTGAPPTESPFNQGRLAFLLSGDWEIQSIPKYNPDMDFGITYIPVPQEGAEPATWAGGWSTVIPQGAKQPEAAFKFMQFICGAEGQKMYTISSAHTPTLRSAFSDPSIFSEKHRFFIENLLNVTQTRPPLPVGAKYWDELEAAQDKISLNQEDPATAFATVKENTQPLLDPFCAVAAPPEPEDITIDFGPSQGTPAATPGA